MVEDGQLMTVTPFDLAGTRLILHERPPFWVRMITVEPMPAWMPPAATHSSLVGHVMLHKGGMSGDRWVAVHCSPLSLVCKTIPLSSGEVPTTAQLTAATQERLPSVATSVPLATICQLAPPSRVQPITPTIGENSVPTTTQVLVVAQETDASDAIGSAWDERVVQSSRVEITSPLAPTTTHSEMEVHEIA